MKTLKTLLSLFAIAAVFSASAYAQNDNISVTADIVSAITVTGNQDLQFGSIVDGTSETITLATANNSTLGKFTVSSITSGVSVDFVLTGDDQLTGGGDPLPVTLTAGYATSDDGTAAAGNPFTLTNNDGTETFTTAGTTYWVYVGGQADASGAGAYSGSYTGNVNLAVNYN